MQVHGAAEAVFINLAILADACFHPITVSEDLESIFPYVKEIVLIDVALGKASVDVGAGGNGAVHEDGSDGDAGSTEVIPIADLALVWPDVGLAAELGVNLAFLSGGDDEIHQLLELFIVEL